jgi:hypothetical protein
LPFARARCAALPHHVGGERGAARAVDPEHDRGDLGIVAASSSAFDTVSDASTASRSAPLALAARHHAAAVDERELRDRREADARGIDARVVALLHLGPPPARAITSSKRACRRSAELLELAGLGRRGVDRGAHASGVSERDCRDPGHELRVERVDQRGLHLARARRSSGGPRTSRPRSCTADALHLELDAELLEQPPKNRNSPASPISGARVASETNSSCAALAT